MVTPRRTLGEPQVPRGTAHRYLPLEADRLASFLSSSFLDLTLP